VQQTLTQPSSSSHSKAVFEPHFEQISGVGYSGRVVMVNEDKARPREIKPRDCARRMGLFCAIAFPQGVRDIQGVKVSRCLYCGKRLPKAKPGAGRRRRYCNPSHKDRAYRARLRHLLVESRL